MKGAVKAGADALIKERNYLTELDVKIGDGDHGINMARGAQSVLEELEEHHGALTAQELVKLVGEAFLMNVGGSAGPLYGSGFISASKALADPSSALDAATISRFMHEFNAAIQKRGHAELGDKTILDVTIPLEKVFVDNVDQPLAEVLKIGRETVRSAVEYTKELEAKRGRASYLGARSVGFIDPGAASSALLYREISLYIEKSFLETAQTVDSNNG